MADFADRIKLYRTMNGFTQEEVASRLGTNKQNKKAPDQLRPRASFYIATGEVAGCLQFCFCGIANQSVSSELLLCLESFDCCQCSVTEDAIDCQTIAKVVQLSL